jgi:hypothetical protein
MNDIGENAKRIQKIVDNLKHLGKQDRGHMDELADVGKNPQCRGNAARHPYPQTHRCLYTGTAGSAAAGQR